MLVSKEFSMHRVMLEKYDVIHLSSNVSGSLRYGYNTNEAGFGWTNAVFTALYDELPSSEQKKLLGSH